MYNPEKFRGKHAANAEKIIHQYPFATLITGEEISHVPLVLEKRGENWFLVGHLSRANLHAKKLEEGKSLAIFHGPHSYITPLWYSENDVPTWNYIVVHLKGAIKVYHQEEETLRALKTLSEKMEGQDGWQFFVAEDLAGAGVLQKAIVAFEMKVETVDAKFKLSQNRSQVDFSGVVAGLEKRSDDQSLAVKDWMLYTKLNGAL